MINDQLIEYIKQQLEKGSSGEIVYNRLLDKGWKYKDIKEGFDSVKKLNRDYIVKNISYNQKDYPESAVKKKKKSKFFVWFFVLLFILLGIFLYYKREEYKIVPFIKFLLTENQMIDDKKISASVGNGELANNYTNELIKENNNSSLTNQEERVEDCGDNIDCFINSANLCQKAKISISKIDEKEPLGLGTVDIQTEYEVLGPVEDSCLTRMRILSYDLKYYQEIIDNLIEQGESLEEINEKQKNSSQLINNSGQVCSLSLNKKMGDVLIEDLINPSEDKNDYVMVKNLNIYDSGLTCEQYTSINEYSF